MIDESLRQRYFVHTVRSIRSIDLFQGYLTFGVDTDLGDRTFIMRWQGDKAQDYGTAGKMLLDTEENRYLVSDVNALAENERRLFLRYIYW